MNVCKYALAQLRVAECLAVLATISAGKRIDVNLHYLPLAPNATLCQIMETKENA